MLPIRHCWCIVGYFIWYISYFSFSFIFFFGFVFWGLHLIWWFLASLGYKNAYHKIIKFVIGRKVTYCFGNNLSATLDIGRGFKKHPSPFVTAFITRNIWDASLLESGGFHPTFPAVKRHIHPFDATTTSWYCISAYCYLHHDICSNGTIKSPEINHQAVHVQHLWCRVSVCMNNAMGYQCYPAP